MATRGVLLCFEGIDHSGKSTQGIMLVNALIALGNKVVLIRFPDRTTPSGKVLDAYLHGVDIDQHVAHLLFSSNRWELVNIIKSYISNGITVVLDRYVPSGIAYSVAKGLDAQWCSKPDIGLPKPDMVFWFALNPEIALRRGQQAMIKGKEKEIFDDVDFLVKVHDVYNGMALADVDGWCPIDASDTSESVHNHAMSITSKVIHTCSSQPLKQYV